MHPPDNSVNTGGRLSGEDVRKYMEDFAERFLKGKIRFETEVLNIRRGDHGRGWKVLVRDGGTGGVEKVSYYSRIILCTGVSFVRRCRLPIRDLILIYYFVVSQGCSSPHYPELLTPDAAKAARFFGPVLHSMHFSSRVDDLLTCTKPFDSHEAPGAPIIVVGGGKSAQECA